MRPILERLRAAFCCHSEGSLAKKMIGGKQGLELLGPHGKANSYFDSPINGIGYHTTIIKRLSIGAKKISPPHKRKILLVLPGILSSSFLFSSMGVSLHG